MWHHCRYYFFCLVLYSCHGPGKPPGPAAIPKDSVDKFGYYVESKKPITHITTKNTTPVQVIAFARSLKGIPYQYGSTDPAKGFDCSGFITYVFNHFDIIVPRQSVDFTSMTRAISLKDAKPGDLILFTGTDSTVRVVGHMGIIVSVPPEGLKFIHSTSGRDYGVTETPLNKYYAGRYLKTIRIFPQNDLKR